MKKISIVIATHNREDFLKLAIDSLRSQTYSNIEIIIVEDSCSDRTYSLINRLENEDNRVKSFITEKNIGPGAARNIGIEKASGDFIAILDDDDISVPERLKIQADLLNQNPDVELVFSLVDYVDENYKKFDVYPKLLAQGQFPQDPKEIFKLIFTEYCHIPNTTIMMRKDLWKKYLYPEDIWPGEDWFLICQLAAKGVKMVGINQPLVKVYRASERKGLLSEGRGEHYKSSIALIRKMRRWLHSENINEFDPLYRIAKANRLILGSKENEGLKHLILLLRGAILNPENQDGRKMLKKYKTFRLLSRFIGFP